MNHNPYSIKFFSQFPQNIRKKLSFVTFLISLLILSGCNRFSLPGSNSSPQTSNPTIELEEVLKGNQLLALLQGTQIVLVDPDHPYPFPIYQLTEQEIPLTNDLYNFQLSPQRNYVVWYSPNKGLIKLNIITKQSEILAPPSDWINKNPHIELTDNPETIHYIDNLGNDLISIRLDDNQKTTAPIPFPYGNVFKISPDGKLVVFVSGYGQSQEFPKYLITTIDGKNPKEFTTQNLPNKRSLITWLPDSISLVTPNNSNTLIMINSMTPTSPTTFYQYSTDISIEDLRLFDQKLYIKTPQFWSVIDITTQKLIGRAPLEIAKELNNPQFFPWHNDKFLIQTTIRTDPDQFNQLWLSNYMGVKKKVIDSYHQVTTTTDTPKI